MTFTLEDKLLIEKDTNLTISFLKKNYGITEDDYYVGYKNIERIYDFAVSNSRNIHPERHGLVMMHVAHEYFNSLKALALDVQAKKPGKKLKMTIQELGPEDIVNSYMSMFEPEQSPE